LGNTYETRADRNTPEMKSSVVLKDSAAMDTIRYETKTDQSKILGILFSLGAAAKKIEISWIYGRPTKTGKNT
jgi:hypothetical protein